MLTPTLSHLALVKVIVEVHTFFRVLSNVHTIVCTLVAMFADYRRNSSPSTIFTPPRSRDQCNNSSAAMFTTQRNHSHGLLHIEWIQCTQALACLIFFRLVKVRTYFRFALYQRFVPAVCITKSHFIIQIRHFANYQHRKKVTPKNRPGPTR